MGAARSGHLQGRKFSLVGMHAKPGTAVQHVGLLPGEKQVDIGTSVHVYDMGPPIHVHPTPSDTGAMPADVLAWMDDLTIREVEGMEAWLEGIRVHLRDKSVSYRYHALPAYQEQLNERGDRLLRRRFSCAGFVERCYSAGLSKPLVNQAVLPEVKEDVLLKIWARREAWALVGIKGPGPWQVLLPGYLLHALERGRSQLPYVPKESDYAF